MKNLYKLIMLFAVSLLTVGCSDDFLDLEQKNQQNFKEWETTEFVYRKAVNLYAPYQKMYDRGYFFYICASDDMIDGRNKEQVARLKNFTPDGGEGYVEDGWARRFSAITAANEIIRNIDRVKDMSVEDKNMFLGESYFTIGFMYFELAYHYANEKDGQGIPIVKPFDAVGEDRIKPRAKNVIENYKYIEECLTKAADYLPYFNPSKDNLKGRAHKTAALAYLAKTYLYWAQYDQSKYALAVQTADKVINSGAHALLPNFADVFSVQNEFGSEYIWSVPSNGPLDEGSILPGVMFENKGWQGYVQNGIESPGYNGWGYFQPTKELYDAYLPGDKRRDITLFKEGSQFTYFGRPWIWTKTESNQTGLMFAKYIQPFANENQVSPNGNHPNTDLDVPLIRYAEVLLIKAEALIADGKNGDVPLNKVRNRAGLPSISGATMEDLKRERRCELAGEFADRHFDLVRWGDAEATYKNELHGMVAKRDANGKLMKDANGNIIFETVKVWDKRTFIPSIHNIWRIPSIVLEKSGGKIKQNAGYN